MLSIVKLNPRKADEGVLLDANVFIAQNEEGSNGQKAKELFEIVEKNYLSANPRFAFYTTNQVLKEIDTYRFPLKGQEVLNYITCIDVTHIDDVINNINDGASDTDKGLLHVLANNDNIRILVSNDFAHICNKDRSRLIETNYAKPKRILCQKQFVQYASKAPREVVHTGLAEIESYLQAHGKLANGG